MRDNGKVFLFCYVFQSVIIARTEDYSFTHIDVAVGLSKTFVMVDSVGQKIVVSFF